MFTINSLLIRTDTTCVKLIDNYVLAGIGGQLLIFDKNTNIAKNVVKVFNGQKIYGIVPNSKLTCCLIFGAFYIKVFSCNFRPSIKFKEVTSLTHTDWILAAKWINSDSNIVTVSMHNVVTVWTNDLKPHKRVVCEERCILYSACLANEVWNDLIVLSGTVFSQVLIWTPNKSSEQDLCPVLYRLNGHKGVIFSIDYNPTAGLICSTSDDRSAILWTIAHKDLLKELAQPHMQISLKCSMYGHSARVFRCQILDKCVLTAGEDSVVNIWSLNGELIRKLEAHQGACVWALDCDQSNNIIATGGGDCGVILFPLKQSFYEKEIKVKGQEVPKRAIILRNNDVVTISEKGLLEYYNVDEDCWTEVCRHNDLMSYALLEVSPCRNYIALAGYYGSIYIYVQSSFGLQLVCKHEIVEKSRIYSLHWLAYPKFLTCGPEGKMHTWSLKENSVLCTATLQLPPSKEQWTTAACEWEDIFILVGDRRGNVYLYSLECTDPIQIIRKAHNYLGVTYLRYENNELLSMGRNSVVKRYHFDQSLKKLSVLSSDKLPFTWLAAMNQDALLLAFLGNDFVVWDYKKRRTLWQLSCGGGHRCWDFYKNTDNVSFMYIKDKTVHLIQFNWNSLRPVDIVEGYHVYEINGALCINLEKINKCLFISGGEDTTMRISRIDFEDKAVSFASVNVLKSHLSSIRVIASCKISETTESGRFVEKHLVFSAGGRAQIVLWELQASFQDKDNLSVTCGEKYSYYEQLQPEEPETRVMDLCIVELKHCVGLIAGCSDGMLKIFLITSNDQSDYKMFLAGSISHQLKCVLKVSHLQICNSYILISMSTNGQIVFWDYTKFINYLNGLTCWSNNAVNEASSMLLNLDILYSIQVHQSGINSFHCKKLSNSKCLFLTGGDDNAVCVNLFEFISNSDELQIKQLSKFHDSSSHCAQVTGVFFTNHYFVTTSIDQKLNIFKWKVNNDALDCSYIQKYNSSIADIQGMQCFQKDDAVYTLLYGNGVELCKIERNENVI